jgi:hypothetical protein
METVEIFLKYTKIQVRPMTLKVTAFNSSVNFRFQIHENQRHALTVTRISLGSTYSSRKSSDFAKGQRKMFLGKFHRESRLRKLLAVNQLHLPTNLLPQKQIH